MYQGLIATILVFCTSQPILAYEIFNCGSHYDFGNVTVTNCDQDEENCQLVTDSTIQMSFQLATGDVHIDEDIFNEVFLQIRGGPRLNLGVTPVSACEILPCPLAEYLNIENKVQVYISNIPPLTAVDLYWVMATIDNYPVLCFSLPVIVVSD